MFERRNTFTKILFFFWCSCGKLQVTLFEWRVEGNTHLHDFCNLLRLKLWTNSTSLKCISNLDSFKLKKSMKSVCYKLGVKDISVLETCYDMVHSKAIKVLNRLGYIINKGSYERMKWMKIPRHWTEPCYSKHSTRALLQDTFTCARASLPYYLVNELSPIPPQISSNNYFHQPKLKNAIEHWNQLSLFYSHIWTKILEY